jgi:hypothetical protein
MRLWAFDVERATLRRMRRAAALAAVAGACLAFAAPAAADDWLPHAADASWTYEWTDSVYNTTPTREKVTVKEQRGRSFVLQWTTLEQGNAPEAPISVGTVSFQETTAGLINTDWSSTPPPPAFPILCAAVTQCNNSLASTYYAIIWGTRGPALAAPLLSGTSWTSTGGAQGDVTSTSDYVGVERVSVPAFPSPVLAAKVRSEVTQAGAIGDPYGSGVRTVWWVYGVGPVKVVFQHGGSDAPVSTYTLVTTNQVAKPPPPDERYFPLRKGQRSTYRWTNTKHLQKASVQQVTTDEVLNGSARFSVKHVSGPIRVAGAYGFTMRGDGATNIWAVTQSASLAPFPQLGPRFLRKDRRRRFTTPIDLMIYGFNPVIPGYPVRGTVWKSSTTSRDYSIFGVSGSTRILGTRTLKVGRRTYEKVLVVHSKLVQKGFPFGSGTRTSYFAPGRGLVKLVFRHGDRSVSTVQLVR